jgi:hypothetical protein
MPRQRLGSTRLEPEQDPNGFVRKITDAAGTACDLDFSSWRFRCGAGLSSIIFEVLLSTL